VRDNNVERGMERMLRNELPWAEMRRVRQRQVVCWYDRMCLKDTNTAERNIEVLQAHIDALELAEPVKL
jgi:hypothetical protein